jgi:hypothetical protein
MRGQVAGLNVSGDVAHRHDYARWETVSVKENRATGVGKHSRCYRGAPNRDQTMFSLSAFIMFAVTLLLACYMLDSRSRLFVLTVAIACALGSAYGFVQGAWPLAFLEALCSLIAARRFWRV